MPQQTQNNPMMSHRVEFQCHWIEFCNLVLEFQFCYLLPQKKKDFLFEKVFSFGSINILTLKPGGLE